MLKIIKNIQKLDDSIDIQLILKKKKCINEFSNVNIEKKDQDLNFLAIVSITLSLYTIVTINIIVTSVSACYYLYKLQLRKTNLKQAYSNSGRNKPMTSQIYNVSNSFVTMKFGNKIFGSNYEKKHFQNQNNQNNIYGEFKNNLKQQRFNINQIDDKYIDYYKYRGNLDTTNKNYIQFRKSKRYYNQSKSGFRKYKLRKKKIWGRHWYKCKKPYWKRKSYKYIKFYYYFLQNFYKVAQNKSLRLVRSMEPQIWSTYYKRKRVKFWFKNKILLRAAWMNRYGHWTQRKLFFLVKSFKKTYSTLNKFLHKYEFTLDRYVLTWGLIPKKIKSIIDARILIQHGTVWVNFIIVTSPYYSVKQGDCVFFFLLNYNYKSYWCLRYVNQFATKFRKGYRTKWLPNRVKKKFKRFRFKKLLNKNVLSLKKRYSKHSKRYLINKRMKNLFMRKYKAINYLASRYYKHFLAYHYQFECSFKYKISISLEPITWFIWLFSGAVPTNIHFKISDLFINRRYYG